MFSVALNDPASILLTKRNLNNEIIGSSLIKIFKIASDIGDKNVRFKRKYKILSKCTMESFDIVKNMWI